MEEKSLFKQIGLNIRRIREEKGLTIQELSDALNIEYNNLIRIEKGRTNPTVGTLVKISKKLNVKLIDLLNIENQTVE